MFSNEVHCPKEASDMIYKLHLRNNSWYNIMFAAFVFGLRTLTFLRSVARISMTNSCTCAKQLSVRFRSFFPIFAPVPNVYTPEQISVEKCNL